MELMVSFGALSSDERRNDEGNWAETLKNIMPRVNVVL
jgi:hypothetical protein